MLTRVIIGSISMLTMAVAIGGDVRANSEPAVQFAEKLSEACQLRLEKQECLNLFREASDREGMDNPELRFRLSERLMGMGQYRPDNLLLAIEILSDLVSTYPDNDIYLGFLASAHFYHNAIDGLALASENRLYGLLASLLNGYLKTGGIESDIVRYAKSGIQQSLSADSDFRQAVSNIMPALKLVGEYDGESETERLVSQIREQAPWEAWESQKDAELAKIQFLDARAARELLLVYCQSTVLMLDEGAYCLDVVKFIEGHWSEKMNSQGLDSRELQLTIRFRLVDIQRLQPENIGNVVEILRKLEAE